MDIIKKIHINSLAYKYLKERGFEESVRNIVNLYNKEVLFMIYK